jgi:hypothetical protein
MVPAVEEQSIEGLREERLVFGGITVVIRVSAEDSGAVAVMRAEPSMQPGRRPGGEPAYVLYYGGTLDAGELRKLAFEAEVAEPSVGGRPIDGGATLTIEGKRVDVIFRDLDAVKHWVAEASEGRFEIEAVDGWVAGMPTYVLLGELATCEALAGELPRPEFPAALRKSATRRWRDTAARALEVAESLALRGDVTVPGAA